MGRPTMDLYSAPSGVFTQPDHLSQVVADDLAKWPWPTAVHLFHYIDDILLTSDSLTELEKAVPQSIATPEVIWLGSQ